MGGPGSGRRPWKPRKRGQQILVRGADGHFEYVTVERTQSGRQRAREAASPRQKVAAAALVSGAAGTVRAAMRAAGYDNPDGGGRAGVRRLAAEVAAEVGLTLERVMRTVAEALDAKKIVVTRQGCVDVADTDARLRAAEIGLRIHGVGQERGPSVPPVTVVVVPMRDSAAPRGDEQPALPRPNARNFPP